MMTENDARFKYDLLKGNFREPVIHRLKVSPCYFKSLVSGDKTFEIRLDDRGYQVGDTVILCEYDQNNYTGRELKGIITYILDSSFCGLSDGYVAFSLITTAPEENKMSLSESLDMVLDLREMCLKGGFSKHAKAIDTVYEWVDKMVAFFYSVGKQD